MVWAGLPARVLLVCLWVPMLGLSQNQFPFITDLGSLNGSGVSLALYGQLEERHRDLGMEVQGFGRDYLKRMAYLNGSSSLLAFEINKGLESAITRYGELSQRNSTLSFINFSKRKKNKKLLALVHKLLMNLAVELRKQRSANVLNGEKLNLFLNTMESLEEIHRMMDVVEDQVRQSVLLDLITRRNKNG